MASIQTELVYLTIDRLGDVAVRLVQYPDHWIAEALPPYDYLCEGSSREDLLPAFIFGFNMTVKLNLELHGHLNFLRTRG